MAFYPNDEPGTLSDSDRKMLFEESGISPEVAEERGYRTIWRRSEVPDEFANWQRRLGLLVPTYSPAGNERPPAPPGPADKA